MRTHYRLILTSAVVTSVACHPEEKPTPGGWSATASGGLTSAGVGTSTTTTSDLPGHATGDSTTTGTSAPSTAGTSDPSSGGGTNDPTRGTTNDLTTTGADEPTTTGTNSTTGGGTEPDATTTSEDPTGRPDASTTDGGLPGTTSGTTSGTTESPMSDSDSGREPTSGDMMPPPANATEPDLLVAMIGDQGSGGDTKAVYKLVKDEGADMLLIAGDFDYGGNPDKWASEMESALGADFPVFAAIGNHDVKAWSGYQGHLEDKLAQIQGAECSGDLGVKASCKYKGLHFILSGIGTKGSDGDHESFIAETLDGDESLWSLCVWHKNMRDLQAGDKSDDITWKALKSCQDHGAIVVMAHEHSYARTRTMTDIGNEAGGHGATGMPELLEVGPGRTFSVVTGLGGKSIRSYDDNLHDDDTWWATIYTSNYYRLNGVEVDSFDADFGALFVRFHVGGDPRMAQGYFKSIKGDMIDEFEIVHD